MENICTTATPSVKIQLEPLWIGSIFLGAEYSFQVENEAGELVDLDMTGGSVKMDWVYDDVVYASYSTEGENPLLEIDGNIVRIKEHYPVFTEPGIYYADMCVTFPNGDTVTGLSRTEWTIKQPITNK